MCGIAGALDWTGALSSREMAQRIAQMIAPIRHRGPDAHGVITTGHVGLGHRRLSILDLNRRADQPMKSRDARVWVVFNGEIYNFRELRLELIEKGYSFDTECDTEVLVYGWIAWGPQVFHRLAGMFSMAIWDNRSKELILARDRFGEKPLFYASDPRFLLFGSETKSFLRWPEFSKDVNYLGIHDYLTFGYVAGSQSAFKNVHKIAPGHYAIFRHDGTQVNRAYWNSPPIDPSLASADPEELCEEFYRLFDQALDRRMIADVPVGAFLSGGVDSSSIVARLSPRLPHRMKTFSAGFHVEGYDETPHAETVSRKFGVEHRQYMMGPELIEDLPSIIWHYGEPYADSSALVTFALAREIRRHVKVALTGDGGDEIFLGYPRYLKLSRALASAAEGGMPTLRQNWEPCLSRPSLKRDLYARSVSHFRDIEKLDGYGPALIGHAGTSSIEHLGSALEGGTPDTAIELAGRTDVRTYLEGDLNVKADIATMAASLEGRAPYLDHDLADWAMTLPQSVRVFEREGRLEAKAFLKRALEPMLPDDILYRDKHGFSVPVRHWLRKEWRGYAYETLTAKRFAERELFSPAFVERLFSRHDEKGDLGTRIWSLLSLELWFQTFVDNDGQHPISEPHISLRSAGAKGPRLTAPAAD